MNANGNNLTSENKLLLRRRILLFVIAFSMLPLFFVSRAVIVGFTQTKDKNEKEIKKFTFDNEPVEIVTLGNNQKSFKLDEKFNQETDWLKGFSLEFKNKSKKPITYLSIEVDFPETKSTGNIMSFPLSYGLSPMRMGKKQDVKTIKSEETVKLELTERKFETLKSFIETRQLLDNLSRVDIRIVFVLFEDGTGWSSGHLVQPDPNNPKKFIPVETRKLGGS